MSASPDPIDVHVGSRVRLRRTLMGLSQEAVGEGLGLTFQQVQKYERGANRIGSSRLYRLSKILEVPVTFFFEGLPSTAGVETPGLSDAPAAGFSGEALSKRETLELVRAYYRITSPKLRKKVFELVKAMGTEGYPDEAGDTPGLAFGPDEDE